MRMQSLLTSRTAILATALAIFSSTTQAQTVYVENFDTAPSSTTADSVSIGGDANAAGAPAPVVMGQWGISSSGTFAGGLLQPQSAAGANARLAGVFLDPTVLSTGAGTYVLEFDVVPDVAGASDNSFVYVYQGSGYSDPPVDDPAGTDFLVLDTTNAGFGGGSFDPVTALGAATASRLAIANFDDTSIARSNEKLQFVYDGTSTIAIVFGAYDSTIGFDNLSIYKSATYSTGFEGFTGGVNDDYQTDFNVAYGSSDGGAAVANTKFLNETLVQWGITSSGNDFAAGQLQPQQSPATLDGANANNVKMGGLFLDPSLFSGAGDYTITFDIEGDALGNESYRAYVFAGSGYDFDGTGDNYLSLSLSAAGFGGYTGLTAVGTGVSASTLVDQDISGLAVEPATNTVSITFTYDGTSAIAFAVGGYNNAATIDNLSIAPYEAPSYTIYGTGFDSFAGGTNAINEFQAGVGNFVYGGPTPFPAGTKVLKHLNPQWGAPDAAAFTTGDYLRPQTNTTSNVKLGCIFLAPEYFKMGSGTYTITFDLTGDPAGNAAYRAYVWNGSGTEASTDDYLVFDVGANGFAGLTGLTAVGAATAAASPLVEKDISFQSQLPGTVQVSLDFTYTEGDTICFAVGGFKNASTIDNLRVSTTMAPPGAVMYSTDFASFTMASDTAPLGEFKTDFNIAYGSEVPIDIFAAEVTPGGEYVIDFTGLPSSTDIYEVFTSTDLATFAPLSVPLTGTTDAGGIGQAIVPASEFTEPTQFFRIDDLWNTKLTDSAQWGITPTGNGFADGVARPSDNPATSTKMMGLYLDPSVFTAGAGTYTVSFEISGDTLGNAAYRAFVFAGSGYDLGATTGGRLDLSLSSGGFAGYTGLTGRDGATASTLVEINDSVSLDNGTNLSNAAAISATRIVSFDFTWDGTSAVAIAIGGFNNASTIDNFFVTAAP